MNLKMDKQMEPMLIESDGRTQKISKFRRYLPQVKKKKEFSPIFVYFYFRLKKFNFFPVSISGIGNNGTKYVTFKYWIF